MKKRFLLMILVIFGIVLVGCSSKSKEVTITIDTKVENAIVVGEYIDLIATATNASDPIVWESSDEEIATVKSGRVTALKPGDVVIIARCGGKAAQILISFDPLVHKVVFKDDAGNVIKEISVADGEDAIAPKAPEKSGYLFYGWDKSIENITEDIEVIAVYKKFSTISYNLGGGKFLLPEDEMVVFYEGEDVKLPKPIKTGCKFLGWSLTEGGTSYVSSTKDLKETNNALYANFQEVSSSFNITYDFNGGIISEGFFSIKDQAIATIKCDAFNNSPKAYWSGGYADYVYVCSSAADPTATFSDRIYVTLDSETGLYKVMDIVTSGGYSWPKGAEYLIAISNSYSGFATVHSAFTAKLEIGDIIVFSAKPSKENVSGGLDVYAFREIPDNAKYKTTFSKKQTTFAKPTRLGFDFVCWEDAAGTVISSVNDLYDGIVMIAKWNEKTPVTAINTNEIPAELVDGDTFKIEAKVAPTDAYFQQVFYKSSNETILTVDETGKIKAVNAGKASITIYDYMKKCEIVKEITVYPLDSIDVKFDKDFDGVLSIGESITLLPEAFGKDRANEKFTYVSANPSVVEVDASGKLTAKAEGEASITISDSKKQLVVSVVVKNLSDSEKVDKLLKLFVDNNYARVQAGNVSLYNDGTERYYDPRWGSVNRYLFDEYTINTDYVSKAESNGNCHKDRRATDPIEFVCVHDTATLTGTVSATASNMSSNETSIHYTVGNDAIYQVVPEKYIAYHAGDGTGTPFVWNDAGVQAKDTKAPEFGVKEVNKTWYLTINGEVSKIVIPSGWSGDAPKLTRLGPAWKVEGGKYYIGTLWYSKDYGYVSSHGGNNDSIGIEMCVGTTGDIYDTWQRTAWLVADICVRNDLDLTRVKQHNTFSGKNCPQCLISAGNQWDEFMKMVEMQYTIMTEFQGAKITFKSNNTDIVDNTGRVFNAPKVTTTVSYEVTVEIGGASKSITLYSVVPGSTTFEQWTGRYPTSSVWNNGNFDIAK